MKRVLHEIMDTVLKTAFGTDESVQQKDRHITDKIADHTEAKIDRMNAATDRLANLQPARNIQEALQQITGE